MKYLILLLVLVQNFVFGQNLIGCKVMPSQPTTSSTSVKRGSNTLMDNYDVKYYNIDLNVSNTSLAINGFVQMKAQAKKDGFNQVVLNLANAFTVDSVYINGKKVTYTKSGDELTIQATTNFIKNQYFESIVYYKGNGSAGTDFPAGMNLGTQGNNSYLYTVSEPYHSYLWWPCKQDLLDKADSAAINITTKGTNLVASNGVLQKTTTIGADKRFEWKTRYPIAYYLLTFSAGPYVEYKTYANPAGFSKPILIQAFVYDQAYLTSNKAVIDQTVLLIEKFSEKFGLYPFAEEKYGYYTAPFKYGALENQTMTMMNAFNFDLVAHELSHQWFGNNVTCTDWSQIWLHEGMADFCESVANEIVYGETSRQSSISYSQTKVLATPLNCATIKDTHIPGNIFNKTNAYYKGATVMNMLRFEIGDDITFFGMLKEYQKKFAGRNANTDSLSLFIKGYTGKDFSTFFNQWIVGTGFPSYTFTSYQRGDTLYVNSTQTTSSTLTPLYAMKMDFNLVNSTGGVTYVTDYQKKSNETFKFLVKNQRITSVKPNPKVWSLYTNNSGSSITPLSGDNFITAFTIPTAISSKITGTTIDVVMPYGTALNSLKATFTVSSGATVKIGTITQTSGTSITNFSSVVLYTVTAQNGMIQTYTVQVTNAKNSATQPTQIQLISNAFSFGSFIYANDMQVIIFGGTSNYWMKGINDSLKQLRINYTLPFGAKMYSQLTNQEIINNVTKLDFSINTCSYPIKIIAEDGTIKAYVLKFEEGAIRLTEFSETNTGVNGIFNYSTNNISPISPAFGGVLPVSDTVFLSMPFGIDLKSLKFSGKRNGLDLTSNIMLNSVGILNSSLDVSKPITLSVLGASSCVNPLQLVVVAGFKNYAAKLTSYNFSGLTANGVINTSINGIGVSTNIIDITLPYGTSTQNLTANFTNSAGSIVKLNGVVQQSGVTVNSFDLNNTYTYEVISEAGRSEKFILQLTLRPPVNDITAFSFSTPNANGNIVGTNINVSVPVGTDVTNLIADFSAPNAKSVTVNLVNQVSGSTKNNFTDPVSYVVTGMDNSTKTFIVTVIVGTLSNYKNIESFSFTSLNPVVSATIVGTNITAVVPYGTNVLNLIPTFSISPKAAISSGGINQVSGVTSGNFTSSKTYVVTAENGTTQTYTVIVSIAKNTEKAITAFGFTGLTPNIIVTIKDNTISATVPVGTDVTKLVATFTASAKAKVSVGLITQISGSTVNDFTKSVIYTVTAEDGTIQEYVVIVTIAPAPKSSEKVINTFSFEGLTPVVVASVSGTNITATVPFGTDVTKLVATFTASSKATLSIGQTIQKSGTSINDFTKSVTYIVTAEDGTTKTYIVTVTIDKNPLGMDEVAASNVAVYPNPNSGVFFVEAATGELEVTILDLHGREVYRYANNAFLGDKMAIDLHELPSSSYVIRITNNGESTQQKLALIK